MFTFLPTHGILHMNIPNHPVRNGTLAEAHPEKPGLRRLEKPYE
jgi:hypothetical protein